MTRKGKASRASGYTVLLVDDNPEYLEATGLILEQEGHQVLKATNGPDALVLLRQNHADLLLLDYFMPGMTGEEVVTQLRQFNPYVQVILQTGYASEHPPREVLRRLDIQGYYDKSEGPEKLLLWTEVGLKSAYTIQLLSKSRRGLRYILDVTPDLHRIQPLEDLLQGILWQVVGLLGAVNSFLAILPENEAARSELHGSEGFLAVVEDDTELVICAATGRFSGQQNVNHSLEPERARLVNDALQRGVSQVVDTTTIVPLRIGELTIGVVYLDRPAVNERDMELLHLFANQAAVAIHNAQLYQMATRDALTGVYVRRFFEQCLLRELRTAFRVRWPLTLLMMDVDGMKRINDLAGHLAGDQALALVGRALRDATRASDIVGRYGGDEFVVILPQADLDGAGQVGERFLHLLREKSVAGPAGPLPVLSSVGLSRLVPHAFAADAIPRPVPAAYFREMALALLQQADEAMYQAKRLGGHQVVVGGSVEWQSLVAGEPPSP